MTSDREQPVRRPWTFGLWIAAFACASAGCSAEVADGEDPGLAADAEALRVGDRGPQVRAVNEYLIAHGYLPNPELARQFPDWRPAVATLPPDLAVFDEYTEQAVRAFQVMGGLPSTGVADAETLALTRQARCGVPDHVHGPGSEDWDPTEKWAVGPQYWGRSSFTWSYTHTGAPAHLSAAAVQNMLTEQFNKWTSKSGYTFTRQTSGGHIAITWRFMQELGLTTCSWDNSTKRFSKCPIAFTTRSTQADGSPLVLSITSPPRSTDYDLASVALHEIGHALGIKHSSRQAGAVPVMWPWSSAGTMRRALQLDDIEALHALRDGLLGVIQANPPDGSVGVRRIYTNDNGWIWALGKIKVGNGYRIYRWNGVNAWTEHPFGGQATDLAITANGKLWHINQLGEVYAEGASGWERKPGYASAITAIGNEIWALGFPVARGDYDKLIYRWHGTEWTNIPGYATDIAGTADPILGGVHIWYINEFGEAYNQHVLGSHSAPVIGRAVFYAKPGAGAVTINGGAHGQVFIREASPGANNGRIWVINKQSFIAGDTPGAPLHAEERTGFFPIHAYGQDATMDNHGRIWVTTEADTSFNAAVWRTR